MILKLTKFTCLTDNQTCFCDTVPLQTAWTAQDLTLQSHLPQPLPIPHPQQYRD